MSHLTLKISHSLGQEEATRRLKEKFAAALAAHGDKVSEMKTEWQDHTFSFSFRTMGVSVRGTVTVEPQFVTLDLELPWAAMLMRGAIEERIRSEVAGLLT